MGRTRTTLAMAAGIRAAALMVAAVVLLLPVRAVAEGDALPEYKVKAGYLLNFAKFVEWPAAAFPATNSPFVIAVLDDGEAQPMIERVLAGRNVNGHPVQVRSVSAASLPKDAHIMLVTRAASKSPEEIRAALASGPTLLVGETDEFAELGGVFGFVRDNETVRLTLCLEHATRADLKVSAKLASVARPVKSKLHR